MLRAKSLVYFFASHN